MKMKRLLAVLLIGTMTFSLMACGNKDSKEEPVDSVQQEEQQNEEADVEVKEEVKAETETETEATEETEQADTSETAEIPKGEIIIEELSGKTLAEIIDMGYEFSGVASSMGEVSAMLMTQTFSDDVKAYQNALEGKTVAELRDEYDISLVCNYIYNYDGLTMFVDNAYFDCEVEGAEEANEAHSEESFFDLEEAEEIQDKTVENVEIIFLNVNANFDEASAAKIMEMDADMDTVKSMADELIVESVSYTLVRDMDALLAQMQAE